jgi:glucosamine-6-phosphate deaminase
MYEELARMHERGEIDFSSAHLFDLDTYAGISLSDPRSHHQYMMRHFVTKVGFDPSRWVYLDPTHPDLEEMCRRYEERIARAGGLDLVIDGLGHNGHLGYNEPGAPWDSRTRLTELHPMTIRANARWVNSEDEVPRYGLTMGIATILEAKKLVIIVSGLDKAEIVAKVLLGPATLEVPMTAVRSHRDVTFLLDEAAASRLGDAVAATRIER